MPPQFSILKDSRTGFSGTVSLQHVLFHMPTSKLRGAFQADKKKSLKAQSAKVREAEGSEMALRHFASTL